MMGKRIEGHANCEICHPDLNKKWAKRNAKGAKKFKHSISCDMQESTRLLDLLSKAKEETFDD